jgi:hypothetical protein
MRLIALIEAGEASRRILRHTGEATGVPTPARAPPQAYEYEDDTSAQAAPAAAVDRRFQEPMIDDPC